MSAVTGMQGRRARTGEGVVPSSREPAASGAQREYWADNLRVLVIAAVVVFHAGTGYFGGTSWYFEQRVTSGAWPAVVLPAEAVAAFALGPLFLVAGWFSARSLAHKGPGAFARARLLRLGIPLIVFIFLINGLANYVGQLGAGWKANLAADLSGSYGVGPMWFVVALLAFSLVYAMVRRLHRPRFERRWPTALVIAAAAGLMAATAFLTWLRWPLDDSNTFLLNRWAEWPQGAALFALGVWAGETGRLEDLMAWARRLRWVVLAGVASLAAWIGYQNARGNLGSTLHSGGWPTLLTAVLYGVINVAFAVWFTAMIRARWSGDGPLRARAGQASYAAYVLHALVLTAVMALFASLALAPELKFLIVVVVAVPACFLAGYALTRLPAALRAAWRRPQPGQTVQG
jgi:glucans biosynthesis protein C